MASGKVANFNSCSKVAHAVMIPFPIQSHIKAMLMFAKLLHHKGFYITFVNTEFNQKRLLKTTSLDDGLPDFRFETIPDSLPPSDPDSTQDIPSLCDAAMNNFFAPFVQLIEKINENSKASTSNTVPCVSCIVSDGSMPSVGVAAAQHLGIPQVNFFTISACALLGLRQYRILQDKGLVPLIKDESSLTNGFLDTIVDWIPGIKNMRLKDLPCFDRNIDSKDPVFKFSMEAADRALEASAVVIHTFDALEKHVLEALSPLPNLYAIGPLQLLLNRLPEDPLKPIQYSLWKEETESLKWLNTQNPNSVIYVSFGSVSVLTKQQVLEFGWGLANSNHPFLWVIRPDMVIGESTNLPMEFMTETKERSLIISWAPQEEVLSHPSVGGFVTHCGWNSILESLTGGVPMLCYPFYGDQQPNCRFTCDEWGVGLEIDNDVKRDQVEKLVRELMEGDKGKKMKSKAMEWKKLVEEATSPQGSSSINLDNLVSQLVPKND